MSKALMDEVGFGKHRSSLVIDVIKNDTKYMHWLIRETGFELDNDAFAVFKQEAEDQGLEI